MSTNCRTSDMADTITSQRQPKRPKWAHNPEDNWYGVEDARERKKIQDRLAQRARRRRLATSKAKRNCDEEQLLQPGPDLSDLFENDEFGRVVQGPGGRHLLPRGWTVTSSDFFPGSSWMPPIADQHFLPRPTITIYAALYKHGIILGISSECGYESTSPSPGTNVPKILHPTSTQLTTSHRQWIDRFPFPRLRDNLITLGGIIDYEEFVADLFIMTSFKLKPGSQSWDPEAWKMGKEFGVKWAYLFF